MKQLPLQTRKLAKDFKSNCEAPNTRSITALMLFESLFEILWAKSDSQKTHRNNCSLIVHGRHDQLKGSPRLSPSLRSSESAWIRTSRVWWTHCADLRYHTHPHSSACPLLLARPPLARPNRAAAAENLCRLPRSQWLYSKIRPWQPQPCEGR